jgi:Protein of unknown function (DUF3829)
MAMNSTVKIVAALAAGLVAYAVGGNLGDMFKGGVSGGGEASAPASLLSAADTALQAKLENYIACMNHVDDAMRAHYREYQTDYAPRAAGEDLMFSTFRNFKIEVFEQNNEMSKECADGLDAAGKMAPAMADLDGAGKTYADTLRALLPVLNAADIYYDQEDYKDDAMAKGKELDAQMAPLFETLFTAGSQIDGIVSVETGKLRRAELVAMEAANGRDYDWHMAHVMVEARTAIDAIDALGTGDALTVAGLQPVEDAMQKAFDEATAFAAANPDVKTALGNKPLWFGVQGNVASFLGDIKDLRRAVGDGSADVSPQMQAVFSGFNDLVDSYNMMANVGG